MDELLPSPGVMSGQYQTIPNDSYDLENLPVGGYNSALLTLPNSPPVADYFDPSNLSGDAASVASLPQSSGYNWDNFLGGLAQSGIPILQQGALGLVNKAEGNSALTLQQQLLLQQQQSGLQSQSLITILVWGGIAWFFVTLISSAGGK